MAIGRDITDLKQAEQSIPYLSQAIEQSPVSIMIANIEDNIEFVNVEFTQITGYSFTEVLGQNLSFLKSGETSADEYRRLRETISSGGVWQGEFHRPVKMDPSRIDQIPANLCINARDAISGMGRITIETHRTVFEKAYSAEHREFSPGEDVKAGGE